MRPLVMCLALVAFIGCDREDDDSSENDVAAITASFDSVVSDVRAANWTSWANRFSEDARFYPANSPALIGRPALVAWAQAFPPVESFSFENVMVEVDGDLAYGTSAVLIKLKDLPADTAKQLVVFKRDSTNAWKVVVASLNSDLPAPAPPPPQPVRR